MIPFVGTPIWLVSLILAAIAPFCVRSVADAFERSLRRRTLEAIARATARRSNALEGERGLEALRPNEEIEEGEHARPRSAHNSRNTQEAETTEAARIEDAHGEARLPAVRR